MNVVLHSPMPMPISNEPAVAHATPRSGVSVTSTALPAISASVPSTAVSRYVVRTISRAAIEARDRPGDRHRAQHQPPASALRPIAPCT